MIMTTKSKMVLGLVGAAAAGVALGLLLAPEKGTDLRARIGKTAGDWGDSLTDLFANAKGELQNLARKGRDAADDSLSNARERFS
ncbi:MAG: YtxH domain-containing protein [Chitinophagaceae bacterium]|uniref:YtxH domain-containing protein n=2 Tax=Flaviaesturariibacter aridisoli TaxID=2545761 RepID=A0A4R4E1D7_9BACT|nr:MAG: YtxH domain-containing protein [Chitinophagaceae bacterium]TCZ69581.1 YtxH domain-containing protein [Flaviaesturariibacter aridisoli]